MESDGRKENRPIAPLAIPLPLRPLGLGQPAPLWSQWPSVPIPPFQAPSWNLWPLLDPFMGWRLQSRAGLSGPVRLLDSFGTTSRVLEARTGRRNTPYSGYKCTHCQAILGSPGTFHAHLRTHMTSTSDCPICGKTFSRHWLLQGHIRTHTGEKPFQCPVCSKAFADKSNLRAHVQTHSGVKPFVCKRCGKAFALKSYLSKHEESACFKAHLSSKSESHFSPG